MLGGVRLVLVRHAEAAPGEPDELRPLTPNGRDVGPRPGRAARRGRRAAGCRADEPAPTRAGDRCRARACARRHRSSRTSGWRPALPQTTCPPAVRGRGDTVVVVGHQPDCGRIAAELSGGPSRRSRPAARSSFSSRLRRPWPPSASETSASRTATRGDPRDQLRDRARRGLRPARPERRGQDDHGRDPGGLPQARRGRGRGARGRPGERGRRVARADRRRPPVVGDVRDADGRREPAPVRRLLLEPAPGRRGGRGDRPDR